MHRHSIQPTVHRQVFKPGANGVGVCGGKPPVGLSKLSGPLEEFQMSVLGKIDVGVTDALEVGSGALWHPGQQSC